MMIWVKKNFRKRARIFACGLQCNRKMLSCIFPAGFCFIYKDAARKTEWFFCIHDISQTKRSLAEKLWDIAKHTLTKLHAKFGAFSTKFTFD